MQELFQKGAQWKHRNLGFEVFISHVLAEDTFLLGSNLPFPANIMFRGEWTALELIRQFAPIYQPTYWSRILQDGLFED